MIVERVKAGLKRAKAEGKVLGRPRVSAAMEAKVVALTEARAGYASNSARTWHRELHGSTYRSCVKGS